MYTYMIHIHMGVYIYIFMSVTTLPRFLQKTRMIFYPAAGFFLIDSRPSLHGDFLVPFLFMEFGGFTGIGMWHTNYIYKS